MVQLSHPREQKRAALAAGAEGRAARARAHAGARKPQLRVNLLTRLIEGCTIRARGPGMVVYEENPERESAPQAARRRSRVRHPGHRHHSRSQPHAGRGFGQRGGSASRQGRPARATMRVEAFPDLRLTGKVTRVGTLASASAARPFDDKRFDLIITLDPTTAELRPEMTHPRRRHRRRANGRAARAGHRGLQQPGHGASPTSSADRYRRRARSSSASRTIAWSKSSPGLHEGERVGLAEPGAPAGLLPRPQAAPARANALQPR